MDGKIGFTILGSGSSGNSAIVHVGKDAVMIDAGFSLRETRRRMECAGLPQDLAIHGILVTHEHDDHIKGLRVCSNHFNAPIFTTAKCAESLRHIDSRLPQMIRISPGGSFELGRFVVTPFSIPHDAADPVGYVLFCDTVKIGLATDIGYASSGVEYEMRDCHSLLLESNHDVTLLAASGRPWSVKQRILGRMGHLCNEAASELLRRIVGERTHDVVLGHISRECNQEELVRGNGRRALHEIGRDDICLEVASQGCPLPTIWN